MTFFSMNLPLLLDLKVDGLPQKVPVVSVIHPFADTYGAPFAQIKVNHTVYGISYDAATELWWVHPRPAPEFYDALYSRLFYSSPLPEQFGYATLELDSPRRAEKAVKNWDDIRRYLPNLMPGALFEVGCGTGEFLLEARRRGWYPVVGNELEPNAATVAMQKGLLIYQGMFEQYENIGSTGFDMVFADNVIEHTMQPLNFAQKAFDILKPGGYLILRLPDTQSFGPTLKLIDHTFHFSRLAIEKMLKIVSFKVLHIFHSGTYYGSKYAQDTQQRIENMTVIAQKPYD